MQWDAIVLKKSNLPVFLLLMGKFYGLSYTISPNPLKSTALIEYSLQSNSLVTIKILDFIGQEILTIVGDEIQQGKKQIVVNITELPTGMYFVMLKTNGEIQILKMLKTR